MGEHDQFELLSAIAQGMLLRQLRFLALIGVPHLHSVRWYSTTDGRIATMRTADDPSTRLIKIWWTSVQ